jgi:hypothetical protein
MIAIAISFWAQWISQGLFILVALIWLVPDRRIEKALVDNWLPDHLEFCRCQWLLIGLAISGLADRILLDFLQ